MPADFHQAHTFEREKRGNDCWPSGKMTPGVMWIKIMLVRGLQWEMETGQNHSFFLWNSVWNKERRRWYHLLFPLHSNPPTHVHVGLMTAVIFLRIKMGMQGKTTSSSSGVYGSLYTTHSVYIIVARSAIFYLWSWCWNDGNTLSVPYIDPVFNMFCKLCFKGINDTLFKWFQP